MADFKLCIADSKSGKTYQKEVKGDEAAEFMGKNIGHSFKGELIGATGTEFQITGGSDKCGFPMRSGIKGRRKRLNLLGGVGLRKNLSKGVKKRKTVCGHKINETISQINIKVTKEGSKKLDDIFGAGKGEAPKEEKKEAPAEKAKKEEPKEAPKAEEKPKEEPKAEVKSPKEAPKEEKPEEPKEDAK
ncbi:30S ribosomal protein S6e [Candidatus Woesearchaeota archaeon]|nr:30S ribosomal protein S6e [Candidatus Woesearchaeota archaeon]